MGGFVHRERVQWADLDAFQHLNNVVYQRYFETAWINYRSKLDFFGDPFTEDFFGMVLAEFHINYRAPVQFDETLDIALTVDHIGKSSVRTSFEMGVNDRLCADGFGVYVGYDIRKRRAAPLPEVFRTKLQYECASGSG